MQVDNNGTLPALGSIQEMVVEAKAGIKGKIEALVDDKRFFENHIQISSRKDWILRQTPFLMSLSSLCVMTVFNRLWPRYIGAFSMLGVDFATLIASEIGMLKLKKESEEAKGDFEKRIGKIDHRLHDLRVMEKNLDDPEFLQMMSKDLEASKQKLMKLEWHRKIEKLLSDSTEAA